MRKGRRHDSHSPIEIDDLGAERSPRALRIASYPSQSTPINSTQSSRTAVFFAGVVKSTLMATIFLALGTPLAVVSSFVILKPASTIENGFHTTRRRMSRIQAWRETMRKRSDRPLPTAGAVFLGLGLCLAPVALMWDELIHNPIGGDDYVYISRSINFERLMSSLWSPHNAQRRAFVSNLDISADSSRRNFGTLADRVDARFLRSLGVGDARGGTFDRAASRVV